VCIIHAASKQKSAWDRMRWDGCVAWGEFRFTRKKVNVSIIEPCQHDHDSFKFLEFEFADIQTRMTRI
jgi:hypothetical protein